jgi:hypothetical protein
MFTFSYVNGVREQFFKNILQEGSMLSFVLWRRPSWNSDSHKKESL